MVHARLVLVKYFLTQSTPHMLGWRSACRFMASIGSATPVFQIPSPTGSPTNVAVGPDRNVWYTKGGALGRVTTSSLAIARPFG